MNPFDSYLIPEGFFSEETLFQNKRYQLFRAVNKDSRQTVTLKKTASTAMRDDVSRLGHEFNILKSVNHPCILKPYELIPSGRTLTLVQEWFEGESLRERLKRSHLTLDQIFRIAIQVAETLSYLHNEGIVHRDINPSNILVSADNQIKVIDFGISTAMQAEQSDIVLPDLIEGTLVYMAPEQTGHTRYAVSALSDLYSLGILLYEMLAGRPPFNSTDPLEIIHFHLSRKPAWLQSVNPALPFGICAVTQKLLEKNPDDRYQSAYSLLADLRSLHSSLASESNTDHFIAGAQAGALRFRQTQKLYGREREARQLLRHYDELDKAGSTLVLVSGYSGVGKSALIKEIQQPVLARKGLFISGKFDQFRQSIPYASFIEAFRELIKTLLAGSEEKINFWKQRLSQTLGENGGLITEVIPFLEKVIGPQLPVQKLQPAEQEYRFRTVFLDFIYAFTAPGTPMVIFLDDLQWSDLPSLNLIEQILNSPGKGSIMLLGTYRDNEVTGVHPLAITLQQLRASAVPIREIKLHHLNEAITARIVADSFGMNAADAARLGKLAYQKTNGNPFFLNRFLKSMYDNKHIVAHDDKGWEWDDKVIEGLDYADNVIDLMTRELSSLPLHTRETMKVAAVLGNTFSLQRLSLVMGKTQNEVFHTLSPALKSGYILPLDSNYRSLALAQEMKGSEWEEDFANVSSNFRFLHDRVQQSLYALLSEAERNKLHLHTGRILLTNTPADKVSEFVFDITSHFSEAIYLVSDEAEKLELARLFLLAGRKAKDSTSYDIAVRSLSLAMNLHPISSWTTDYQLTYDIYLEGGECEYLNNNHEKAAYYFEELLKYARTNFEKLRVYYVHSSLFIKLSKTADAMKIGRIAMRLYNINFPEKPLAIKLATLWEMTKYLTLFSTRYRKKEKLFDLKDCEDPEIIAINQFLIDIATSAYQESQELMMLVCFRIIRHYLRYGFTDASGWGFSGFSTLVLSALGLPKRGFSLWDITIRLHQRTNSPLIRWKLQYTVDSFLMQWRRPLAEGLDSILENFKGCIMNGDPIFSGYCLTLYLWKKSATGYPLPAFLELAKEHIEYLRRNKITSSLDFSVCRLQTIKALAGLTPDHGSWDDTSFSSQDTLKRIRETSNNTTLAYFYCAKIPLLYYFGKYREAIDWSFEGQKYKPNVVGQILVFEWDFFTALAIAANYSHFSKQEQKTMMKEFDRVLKWMKLWAEGCAVNFEHCYKLLLAEKAVLTGKQHLAMGLYEQAISMAGENGYIQMEAIANERAGIFMESQGYKKLSRSYFQSAWDGFHAWGAKAVCKELERRYPSLLSHSHSSEPHAGGHAYVAHATGSTTKVVLDLSSILKASQNLASQVRFEELLQSLMHIVIENAGAQRGCLLLERSGVLCIEAEGSSGPTGNQVLPSLPAIGSGLVPESIVQYCWRAGEPVVIDNAMKDEQHFQDPFIAGHKILSVLCLPLADKGVQIGLLYLENSLLEGVFTANRLDLLTMLSGQIGISIQNAQLYDNLEGKVRERTLEIEKQQTQLEEEMGRSNQLLLNILPEKTALDLKTKGYSKATSYPNVHVMFCDIEGFTKRVEKMGAEELVDDIHEFFSGLDDIMLEFGIEKIKTIGDAYLCVAGLSEEQDTTAAIRIVRAAKATQAFVIRLNDKKVAEGRLPFHLRIGIHSGPVIAGVVGKSKFAYDIWGDTVNTASRMETAGRAGKINISDQTYVQVKDHFSCTPRGKLEAKNKGLVEMYFVE